MYCKSSFLTVGLFVALAAPCGALASVVDQSQLTANTGSPFEFTFTSVTNYPLGQSFTAGLNGPLTRIYVFSNGSINAGGNPANTNDVTLEVRAGNGTGGALLGSLTQTVGTNSFDAGLGGYPVIFDTTSLGVNMVAGSVFTFLITNVTGAGDLPIRGILSNDTNPYAAGRAYHGAGYGDTPDWDLMFQTHVPGPAPLALMSIVGAVGLRRRRVGA